MAENKHDKKQNRIIAGSLKNVSAVFGDTAWKAIHIATNSGYDSQKGEPFSFNRTDTRKKAEKMLKQFVSRLQSVVLTGNNVSWSNANDKNDALITTLANGKKIPKELLMQWQHHNLHALTEFNTRTENGMNLSDRIWEVGKQYRSELELALSLGIGEGKSADVLSRDVRQYLQHPNMLFRRVRDADHNLQLSKPAQAYHPGRGVYRSSYKNALRLTATENNMAYRTADYTRWQQMNFILGIQIKTSPNNHPVSDICDTLQGRYPKEFKFRGWHPWCRCIAVPILPNEKAFFNGLEGDLKGEGLPYGNPITSPPKRFNKWIKANTKRIIDAKNTPYWIQDNFIDGDIAKGFSFTLPEISKDEMYMRLGSVSIQLKDSTHITDEELQEVIFNIANQNDLLRYTTLKTIEIRKDKATDEFMSIGRKRIGSKYINREGYTLSISDINFTLKNGEIYNPYKELKDAFRSIADKRKLTYLQESALESLWHELLHGQAMGWKNPLNNHGLNHNIVEYINELCARQTYHYLLRCLGVKNQYKNRILTDGIGYTFPIKNLTYLLTDNGLNTQKLYKLIRERNIDTYYEDIPQKIFNLITKHSTLSAEELEKLFKEMTSLPSEFKKNYHHSRVQPN